MTENKPEIILFDWDGTLVNTLPLIRAAHDAVCASYGREKPDDAAFEAILLMDPRAVFPALYGPRAGEARKDFYEYINKSHLNALERFPYVQDFLQSCVERGIAMGVVSKKDRTFLVPEIEWLGLSHYFTCIVATGDAPREKPFPDPILKALESFPGTARDRVWFMGDAESDMAASAAAGTRPVLVLHGKDKVALVSRYKPLVFNNLGAARDFILAP